MILFMTDGFANRGVVGAKDIMEKVQKLNTFKIPIYGIAYGDSAGI